MEMPEGWKELKEIADRLLSMPNMGSDKDGWHVVDACKLIAEMAKALEWYTKENNWPMARHQFGNKVTYQELDINHTESPAWKVLKKFKEWK